MIGLIMITLTTFYIFSFVTVLYFPKLKTMEPYERIKYARKQMRLVSKWMIKALMLKKEIIYEDEEMFKNLDTKDGVVIISNHSSNLDIPLIIDALSESIDISFVAKQEMKSWPFFGRWIPECGGVFLDRTNPREGIKGIRRGVELVKKGHPLCIFPQGTRKRGFGENEFKKGSFKLVTEAKGYVVPMAIRGSDLIQEPGKKAMKLGCKIIVHIGKPIKVSDLTEEELKNINEILEEKVRTMYYSKEI